VTKETVSFDNWYQTLSYDQRLLVDRIIGDTGVLKINAEKVKELIQQEVKAEGVEHLREEKREDERRDARRDGERGEKPSNPSHTPPPTAGNELPGQPLKPGNELPSTPAKPGTLPGQTPTPKVK
jgi:hypothetical protein